ncbi:MAG: HlyD family type I secretion periplasmic adaptor subunit [Desulfobulbaceae bacterium]|nr:HlyD family type I secretion periplasmic adaptor subunit [Desulfobulbaceae bacterium]
MKLETMKRKLAHLRGRSLPDDINDQACALVQVENTPPPAELKAAQTDTRKIVWIGLLIVGLFFGMGGIWIAMAEISGAVIASGEIKDATERKTVQHLEGGIVRAILVANGSKVKVGQPLFELESSRVLAGVEQLQLQLAASSLEIARLEAEKEMANTPRWPALSPGVSAAKFNELLESETRLFSSRRTGLANQTDLLRIQIQQLEEQSTSLGNRVSAQREVIAALEEELAAKEPLLAERFIDKTSILALKRVLAENRGQLAQFQGSIAEVRQKIAEYQLRISAIEAQYRQEAVAKLSEAQQRQSDRQQQIQPLLDASQRLTVAAPIDGEVVAMNVHSVGGVITPGQPLLDIVPGNSQLIVECKIQVKDITQVHTGQAADVQLLAFNQRTTPKIKGKVVYVSADRLMQNSQAGAATFYLVQVSVDKAELEKNRLYLTSGMPATVFIYTEARTVLDYLLEPINARLGQALRES